MLETKSDKSFSSCASVTWVARGSMPQYAISGWVMEQVGRVPEVGDHFQAEGLDVTVTKVEHRRVLEIQVRVLEEPDRKSVV